VYVKYFIRGDMSFTGLEELKVQLGKDKIEVSKKLCD